MSQYLNRFGLRYFQDEDHYTHADWKAWSGALSSLNVGWLTLIGSDRRAIPESFLRAVIAEGITPIIHIPARVGTISLRDIAPLLKSYADWGVRHVVVFDRPNLQSAWNASDWSRGALVERFIDAMLPLLHVEYEVGLQPMLPPLEPGGDFWDTAFLEAVLSVIRRRSQKSLIDDLGLTAYAWTYGRDLDWGKGGPEAWPQAKPYRCPPGSENQIGFRIYEWYQALMKSVTAAQAEIFVLAGGYQPGASGSRLDPMAAQIEIYQQIISSEVPEYVRCFNFEAFNGSTDYTNWFNHDGSPGQIAKAVLESRRKSIKRASLQLPKFLEHYALVSRSGTQHALQDWEKLGPFAIAVRPTIGFSIEEARHAKKVTILASEHEIPVEIEELLSDSGCEISRINIQTDEKLLDAITAFANDKK